MDMSNAGGGISFFLNQVSQVTKMGLIYSYKNITHVSKWEGGAG